MGVKAVQLGVTGIIPNTTGVGKNLNQQLPTFILLETDDTLASVLVSGYLNKSAQTFGIPYSNHQVALVYTTDAGSVWLQIAVTGTAPSYVYSLIGSTDVASVFVAGAGTAALPSYTFSGDLNTGIYSPAANTVGVTANGALVASIATTGLAVTGLISATTTVTGLTGVIAGASGTAGIVRSYPATAARGYLALAGVANTGDTTVTISNVAMGQTTVMSFADPGSAAGRFLVANTATPFTTGRLIASSGTGGLTVDSGIATSAVQLSANIKAASTADIGGAGAGPISVVVAGLTAASKIVATIASSSNVVSVAKCIATATGFDITFSGDPGAACVVNYVAFVAAQ